MSERALDTAAAPATRRDFLRTSALATVGTGLLGGTVLAPGAYAGGADATIRVGLVGCGGRGSGAAAQALSTEGNVKLTAVADAFADQAQSAPARIKAGLGPLADRVEVGPEQIFTGFDGYRKLIESGIDVVILATPPGFRPIHFEAAVKAGKHVFMEKPVAIDGPGIRQVLAAAKEARAKNLKVGVGLQRRHQAPYLETVQKIHDGAIGDVTALRVYWNSPGVWEPRKSRQECKSEMEYQMRNWYYYNWLCGDHICEQHIHNLDVGNWIKRGYPVKCHGMGGREVRKDKRYGEIFDHFAVEYEYADGSRMFSQCRHIKGTWNSVTEHAHGTKGTCDVSGYAIVSGGEKWKSQAKGKNPYQQEHDDLFDAIRNDRPYDETEHGAFSSLTAIMGRMAVYSGKVVEWEQALGSQLALGPKTFDWDAAPPTVPNAQGEYPIPVPGVTKAF
jgi:predicted dehydrogenase